jgi:hypothetical protein
MKMKTQHSKICRMSLKQHSGKLCVNTYIGIEEWSQLNYLSFQLEKEKEEQITQSKQRKENNKDQNRNQ